MSSISNKIKTKYYYFVFLEFCIFELYIYICILLLSLHNCRYLHNKSTKISTNWYALTNYFVRLHKSVCASCVKKMLDYVILHDIIPTRQLLCVQPKSPFKVTSRRRNRTNSSFRHSHERKFAILVGDTENRLRVASISQSWLALCLRFASYLSAFQMTRNSCLLLILIL